MQPQLELAREAQLVLKYWLNLFITLAQKSRRGSQVSTHILNLFLKTMSCDFTQLSFWAVISNSSFSIFISDFKSKNSAIASAKRPFRLKFRDELN